MRKKKISLNTVKIAIFLITLIIIFNLAPNYVLNDSYVKGKINLIIDNNNVTKDLEHDLFIANKKVIYMSIQDVAKYFDKNISYDKINNQIITTFGEKVAKLPLGECVIEINGRITDVMLGSVEKENIFYIPITAMGNIYELDIDYIEEEQTILLDSRTKKMVKANVAKKCNVKFKPTTFSKTVDKLERAEKIIFIEDLENNWTKIRTLNGIIGYIKSNIIQNKIYIRNDMTKYVK